VAVKCRVQVAIVIARANSKEILEKIIAEDPFHQHKLAEFEITEFLISQLHAGMKEALR
jgi:CMP-N-acetylneuraminic acid synthetase